MKEEEYHLENNSGYGKHTNCEEDNVLSIVVKTPAIKQAIKLLINAGVSVDSIKQCVECTSLIVTSEDGSYYVVELDGLLEDDD